MALSCHVIAFEVSVLNSCETRRETRKRLANTGERSVEIENVNIRKFPTRTTEEFGSWKVP